MLKSQLYEIELRKKSEAKQAVESTKKKIEWKMMKSIHSL
mgnify:CR=1 FL=1